MFVIAEAGIHHHFDSTSCSGIPTSYVASGKQSVSYSDDVPWSLQVGGTYAPKRKLPGLDHDQPIDAAGRIDQPHPDPALPCQRTRAR